MKQHLEKKSNSLSVTDNEIISNTPCNKKINRFSVKFVAFLVTIILISIMISAFILTAHFKNAHSMDYHEGIFYTLDFIPFNIIGIIGMIACLYAIYMLTRKFKLNVLLIISLILVTSFSIFWVNFAKAPVRADQKFVLAAAKAFTLGDYSFLEKAQYLYVHPLQLGIVFFLELCIRILHTEAPIFLQNLNIVFTIGCFYILYKLTKLIFKNPDTERILLILFPSFVLLPFLCVLVYGNIFGFFFALLAILFLFYYYQNRKIKYLIFSSLSIIISMILKSNYQIIFIAILISLLLDLIEKFDKKIVIIILLTVVCLKFSNLGITNLAEIRSGIPANDGIPMVAYIAMGIEKPITRAARMVSRNNKCRNNL